MRATVLLLLLSAGTPAIAAAQLSAFQFDPTRADAVGTVYHYLKSNRDGSHASRIAVYRAAWDRIESLKYDSGATGATLVSAEMDWPRMSVRRLLNEQVAEDGRRTERAALRADSATGAITLTVLPDTVVPAAWPWHSYDFDFASLSVTMPHLSRADRAFEVYRTDIVYRESGPTFANVGTVRLRPVGEERRDGARLRRWEIGGPGLLDSTGVLWTDREHGHLVEFRIPIPDEPGMRDGWLRLVGTAQLSLDGWDAFVRDRAAGR